MPELPDEPDTNEPIPTPADDTGVVSGDEPTAGEETGDPPADLDDGPLVAAKVNLPAR